MTVQKWILEVTYLPSTKYPEGRTVTTEDEDVVDYPSACAAVEEACSYYRAVSAKCYLKGGGGHYGYDAAYMDACDMHEGSTITLHRGTFTYDWAGDITTETTKWFWTEEAARKAQTALTRKMNAECKIFSHPVISKGIETKDLTYLEFEAAAYNHMVD